MNIADLRASLEQFIILLVMEEKCLLTRQQYRRDVSQFIIWLEEQGEALMDFSKETVITYKEVLKSKYEAATVNAKLAALNRFLSFTGRADLRVKPLKLQHKTFCSLEEELTQAEYERLVKAAKKEEDERILLILETIGSTGIRVSELQFITVETVLKGETSIQLKGKTRQVMLPKSLRELLMDYISRNNLVSGPVFVTRSGKPLSRTYIWKIIKDLGKKANVDPDKVYPHNLRHLFARCFYSVSKDIARLADILGHSSINTTRIYIISTGEEHQQQLDSLNLVI